MVMRDRIARCDDDREVMDRSAVECSGRLEEASATVVQDTGRGVGGMMLEGKWKEIAGPGEDRLPLT